jgi:hypothetical protein
MLDPAIALGASVRFYRLDDRLQPDLDDVRSVLRSLAGAAGCTGPNAVLAAHLFGIETALQSLRALCDNEGLALVEDCAHCLVDGQGYPPTALHSGSTALGLGRWGDIVIASPYKLLPLGEGGMVWTRRPGLAPEPGYSTPLSRELRASFRLLRRMWQPASPMPDATVMANVQTSTCGRNITEDDGDAPSAHFDPAFARDRGLAVTRWLAGGCDLQTVARRRRRRYAQWLEASRPWQLRGLCTPVHPELADDTVPYMFPLQVPQGDPLFAHLRRHGLPAGRWDELASGPGEPRCPWRLSLVHLPVHQEIEDGAMAWMLDVFAGAMGRISGNAP